MGYGINIGLTLAKEQFELNLFRFQTASEEFKYQSFPGDIDIYENIFGQQSTFSDINRHGYAIDLIEFIALRYGRFEEKSRYRKIRTWGFNLNSRGIVKLI